MVADDRRAGRTVPESGEKIVQAYRGAARRRGSCAGAMRMQLAEGQLGDRAGDPDIPTLAAVLDPAELAKELSVVSFPQWQWDASREIRLRVLRWRKASRCTLEIALSTSSGPQELIGKVYAEDRSDVYRTMEQIRKAGFDSEDEFAIPRPVAFLASMRLLLYEK